MAFKGAAGFIAGSISVILDAVNNLSDALSSVITIIGSKLASKTADKKHPFGYGRIEYLSAMIISLIVLYSGIISEVYAKNNVILMAVSVYSVNTKNPEVQAAREKIKSLVFSELFVLQMHSFYYGEFYHKTWAK